MEQSVEHRALIVFHSAAARIMRMKADALLAYVDVDIYARAE
jgi:hypothetical protein